MEVSLMRKTVPTDLWSCIQRKKYMQVWSMRDGALALSPNCTLFSIGLPRSHFHASDSISSTHLDFTDGPILVRRERR